MNFKERIIVFQNKAEELFEHKKNLKTVFLFGIAYLLLLASTLFATATLLFRVVFKYFKKDKESQIWVGNNDNIDQLLQKELVLIDFWAEWCGPCIMMSSTLEEFAKSNTSVSVVKINADLNMKTLKKMNVRGLPHFLLMKNGEEKKRFAGSMTLNQLKDFCFLEKE